MRRRLEFSPSFDSALEVMASGIGKSEPRLVWIVIALATLTAAFDRFAVSHVIDAVYDQGIVWRVDLLWVLGAIVAAFLSGRWARVMALTLAQRASDTALVASTKRLLAADWSDLGAEAPRKALTRIAASMQEDASQAAAALPSIAALPLTAAWLSLLEPTSLLIVIVLIIVGTAILRREGARVSASETVLDHTETAFDRLTERLLAAGPFLRLTAEPQAEFCTRALWPAVDDATRAASVQARAHARAAGILGWLVFVLLLVFLTFAAGSGQDSHWMRALIVVAATLHHARQAAAAYLAFERVGVGAQQLAAVAEQFPVAQTVAPTAPARWSSIAFRRVRFDQRDTPSVFLAAVGPLDLELHRGEIIALTGQPMSALLTQKSAAELPFSLLPLALEPGQRAVLHARIAKRFDQMLAGDGLLEEVRRLRARGDLHLGLPSMRCVGYRQAWEYLDGDYDAKEMRERGIIATRQLAKRQLTWLRSRPDRIVIDCDHSEATQQVVAQVLAAVNAGT